MQNSYVIGVGLTKFIKPRGQVDYPAMGFEAGVKALNDAEINYDDIDQGVACYAYGDSTCGQRVFYQFGMTGIPIYNVNNNCSTGSTGLFMARQMTASGTANAVLVVGFEKMFPGSLQSFYKDRTNPLDKSYKIMAGTRGIDPKAPGAAQLCPTSDGAAAAVVVSETFLNAHPQLRSRAILIAGQALTTDTPTLYNKSAIELVGASMTRQAAKIALAQANVTASSIKLVELHDCFSANEMVTIDALGLCPPGKAHEMVRAGDITYGGRCVINPSGGLISKGHPLGATGIAQCAELVWHLRGWAGDRNVDGVPVALQQNLGLGGAAVVTVYKRADGAVSKRVDGEAEKVGGRGYNPAVEARGLSKDEIEKAVSRKAASKFMQEDEAMGKESRL